jgi:hypothetical protein
MMFTTGRLPRAARATADTIAIAADRAAQTASETPPPATRADRDAPSMAAA